MTQTHDPDRGLTDELVFKMFDLDGDGLITAEELVLVLAELGEEVSSEEATARITRGDADGDGKIDLAEFQAMTGD
jgi:Ca2+-binding EF-hand superfamily protein